MPKTLLWVGFIGRNLLPYLLHLKGTDDDDDSTCNVDILAFETLMLQIQLRKVWERSIIAVITKTYQGGKKEDGAMYVCS